MAGERCVEAELRRTRLDWLSQRGAAQLISLSQNHQTAATTDASGISSGITGFLASMGRTVRRLEAGRQLLVHDEQRLRDIGCSRGDVHSDLF